MIVFFVGYFSLLKKLSLFTFKIKNSEIFGKNIFVHFTSHKKISCFSIASLLYCLFHENYIMIYVNNGIVFYFFKVFVQSLI